MQVAKVSSIQFYELRKDSPYIGNEFNSKKGNI